MVNENPDEVRIRALTANTAQGVLNNLNTLVRNQEHVRTRWIWELLQNARDARAKAVSVKFGDDGVTFSHNGDSFTKYEIAHLVYHGSTKTEDAEAIGQYGSGFLTTHLLSSEIRVSGHLKGSGRFEFQLKRERDSVSDLQASMEKAWQDFQASLERPSTSSDDSDTEFHYPLDNGAADAIKAAEYGIEMLKRCAPFVVIFNDEFSRIAIESNSEVVEFEVMPRSQTEETGLREVVVAETANQNRIERKYVVAQGESAQVAIPVESDGDDTVCSPIREIPKLFLGFPLIGTEDFGFPAVINSLSFTPTEPRDGVFLGQSKTDDANIRNQEVIEEACSLLVGLVEFAAKHGWRDIHKLATVPQVENREWLNRKWLEDNVAQRFVKGIRKNAIVLNEASQRVDPAMLAIPFASEPESVPRLWDLLSDWKGREEVLPRRDESIGWRNALESWARVSRLGPLSFQEASDGGKLANLVHDASYDRSVSSVTHRINRLQLKDGVDAVAWLDRLIAFLIDNGLHGAVRNRRIVPSQAGFLRKLTLLNRDMGIDEKLKDIADLADEWRVKPNLRDARIVSLKDEPGAGDWDNDHVIGLILKNIRDRSQRTPDNVCVEASARLFAWIANNGDWNRLRDFPAFSMEYGPANSPNRRDALKLDGSLDPSERPLAPIGAWDDELQPYSRLFPARRILASDYFASAPNPETWELLAQKGFVRNSALFSREATPRLSLPDGATDDKNHVAADPVSITDIAFMSTRDIGIMARARQSQSLAIDLWRFLTEWAIRKDPDGLDKKQATCVCEDEHEYYPAVWTTPIRENIWVPTEGDRRARQATAQSLADLLRGEWSPNVLNDNPAALKFLEAIGITQFDLTRSFIAATPAERDAQERDLTKLLASTSGDLTFVNQVAEDLKEDKELPAYLDKRRENMRIVRGNQRLGAQVEDLVRQSLESAGFSVKRTGKGSDFEIEVDDIAELELARADEKWLIEVKATRDERVRMTDTQARTAVKKKDKFLLCVVPLDSGQTEPELADVRKSMRFVQNIGARLVDLCGDLDDFVEFRKDITAGESDGVQLEVESGAARVRVANSVWQDEGFPLGELRDNLK